MSYETVTLSTKAYNRITLSDDAVKLASVDSTFEVPEFLELKRTLPTASQSLPVVRGGIKTTHAWKDPVTGKVHLALFETKSSVATQIPPATAAIALDRHQAAVANEGLATDVLTKGVIY